MEEFLKFIGVFLVLTALGFSVGWAAAHSTVGKECQVLGGFYVNSTVYECKVKDVK